MSDSSSIGNVLSRGILIRNSDASVVAKVVEAPARLEDSETAIRVRGDVQSSDSGGYIRIKTEYGDVVVQVDESASLPNTQNIDLIFSKAQDTVKIQPAVAQANPPPLPPLDLQYINTPVPPALNAQALVQSSAIPVEPFFPNTRNIVIHHTPAFSESVPAPITLPAVISAASYAIENAVTSPALAQISAADQPLWPVTDISADGETHQSNLPRLTDQIPLNVIASKIISSPLQEPIYTPSTLNEQSAPSFSRIDVNSVHLPETHISFPPHERSDAHPLYDRPSPSSDLRAGEVKATLIGFTTEQHFPVIQISGAFQTEDQFYTLQTPVADIQAGARLDITPVEFSQTPSPLTVSPITAAIPSFFLPDIWVSLTEIQEVLQQHAPQAAAQFSHSMPTPAAPQNLGVTALFFLSALRSGDVQNWVGQKVIDTLKRAGKSELLSRLTQDFSALSRVHNESAAQEWRVLNLPMAWQNEVHRVVLHYKRDDEHTHSDHESKGGTTRFVMDLNLSQIGKVQIDGLFQNQNDAGGRLDIILRTEQGFSQAMKAEMRRIYKDALDETLITGELSFQDTTEQWVHIHQEMESQYERDV